MTSSNSLLAPKARLELSLKFAYYVPLNQLYLFIYLSFSIRSRFLNLYCLTYILSECQCIIISSERL